jgi:hypothetical protein
MSVRRSLAGSLLALLLAGCATTPTPVMPADDEYEADTYVAPQLTPMVESPPIEPVEPPLPAPQVPAPASGPAREPAAQPAAPAPAAVIPPLAEPSDDEQLIALLGDLQRYSTLQNDDLKREVAAATQALARQRTDVNRVRLAVLYTLVRNSAQDDQRAIQLFENVAKNGPATSSIRQLAAVLHAQVTERQRAVRDEQQKADAAIQKLEALRAMERSLLRDRVRSGGGGGSAGAGGSGR